LLPLGLRQGLWFSKIPHSFVKPTHYNAVAVLLPLVMIFAAGGSTLSLADDVLTYDYETIKKLHDYKSERQIDHQFYMKNQKKIVGLITINA
jgi:hypothetical protein